MKRQFTVWEGSSADNHLSDSELTSRIDKGQKAEHKESNPTKEGQMTNKYVINSSVSPGIRTVKIKTVPRANITPVRMAITKKLNQNQGW